MKSSKVSLKRKSASILKRAPAKGSVPARVGVESIDGFFSRMKDNARELDRGKAVEPGFHLSFEDPADFLEVITPANARNFRVLKCRPVPRPEIHKFGIAISGSVFWPFLMT